VSIFGIAGACRREEFLKMSTKDIEDTGSILVVKIRDTKTNKPRTFVIDGRDHDIKNMVEIYRRYVSLRPSHTKHERLFVFYRNGKCSTQPVGI
jgi:hypothetical protein